MTTHRPTHRPIHREGAAYRRLSPLTPVVRGPLVVLAFVGASWQQLLNQGHRGLLAFLLLGLLLAGVVYGTASWLRTYYWITRDELRIDTGVLVRRSRRIRIDRLQGIDVVQPLVARLVGLAELRFDVASGAEREGSLAYLPHAEALALRRTLLHRRDDLRGAGAGPAAATDPVMDPATDPATESVPGPASDPATPPVPASATGPGNAPVTEPEQLLARLDLRRLLVSLALSTESLVLAAFSVLTTVLLVTTGQAAIAGVALSLVLGLGVTVSRRLTSYYGFELTETASVLHVRRGLTAVSTQTIVPARVQGLVVIEPWLWRPFGWARLEVSLAGYRNTDADRVQASSTLVPVAPRAEVLAVVQHLLGHRHIAGVPLGPPPVRARWRAPVSAWTTAIGQDGRLVVSRRGVFARRLDMVPLERVQSVRLAQGPLDRVLRLVRVEVNSPPGPVHVFARVRDLDEGRALVTSLVSSARTEA